MAVNVPNSELRGLIRLQEVESQISELQQKMKQIPSEIEELDSLLAERRDAVARAQEHIMDGEKGRKRLEIEVEDLRRKLSGHKDRLMEVRTNAEYQAMLHEIDFVQKEIAAKEDLVLEKMLESEEVEETLRIARTQLRKGEGEIAARRKELEDFLKQGQVELQRLNRALEEAQAGLPEERIAQYRRIASARNGTALAPVVDHSCQACHVRLRPQLFAEVRMNQQIHQCENCHRILFYSGD